MKWRRRDEITNEQVLQVSEQLNINPLLARILLNRDMDSEKIRIVMKDTYDAILDPRLLTNCKEAAEVIASYCTNPNAEIWNFADYDCDGVVSGYIMTNALREVAVCPVEVYYPERSEGYGMSMDFCKKLVESRDISKDILVITVDNGIACAEEIKYLKDNGIEVVVTDHHVAKEVVPDCIIVDPHNHNEPDTYKHLAGCGVAFKVAQMVHWLLDGDEALKMFKYLAPVAIGTLADVMPMSLENIAFVKYGLEIINGPHCPKGIKAIKDYIGKQVLTSGDIVWEIAPRINACGRMGDIYLASKIFFEDLKFGESMEDVVNQIEVLNSERKDFTKKAKAFVDQFDCSNETICMINASEYPHGIVGIIANKFIEQYNKLTIVLAGDGDNMVGSARSIEGINIQKILKAEFEKGNIVEYGGHEAAAGLTIKKDKFDILKANISAAVEEITKSLPQKESEEPELIIDELIQLEHINQATFELVNSIPYDNKTFVAPVFALIDVEIEKFSISKSNPNNICFTVNDESGKRDIWAWGFAPIYKKLGQPNKLHIAGTVERDFMKPKAFTLKVIDILGAA